MQAILQLSNLIKKNTTQTWKKKDTVVTRRSYPDESFALQSLGYWPNKPVSDANKKILSNARYICCFC